MYVVYGWYYNDFSINGVFDTEEAAANCVRELYREHSLWVFNYKFMELNKKDTEIV